MQQLHGPHFLSHSGEHVNTELERHFTEPSLQRPREDFMCSQMTHVPRDWDLYPEEPSQIGRMCPTEPQGCSGHPKGDMKESD